MTAPSTTMDHDPATAATELGAKLAAAGRHVCLLLGAGASKAAGLPDLAALTEMVRALDWGERRPAIDELLTNRNLEEALNRLRRIRALLAGGEQLGGLTAEDAGDIERRITGTVIEAVASERADLEPYIRLGEWTAGGYYHLPIEIFNVNYDLLTELALEAVGVPYFDGFVGSLNAVLRGDLVEAVDPAESEGLPREFVRLWKLHGSVNWALRSDGNRVSVKRLGKPADPSEAAAIYPGDAKYDDSRRQPYLVMFDRFRRALAMPETLLVVSGYSFEDQHLNEIVFEAASQRPRSETLVLCHGAIPAALVERASVRRNITALGAEDAIIGGTHGEWKGALVPGVYEGDRFLLGDFAKLTAFLPKPAKATGND